MSLLTRIKADALAARKTKSPKAGVLITLIGEADTKAKTFNPARDITDDEVLAIVKKFIKNIDDTLHNLTEAANGTAIEKAQAEREALEIYLPRQMTEAEITAFAKPLITVQTRMGDLMAALKSAHAGEYDGRQASEIFKRLLG